MFTYMTTKYQLNLLTGDGQEIEKFIPIILNVDPREYFPEPLWVAGGITAFDGGRGTRLLLTRSSK